MSSATTPARWARPWPGAAPSAGSSVDFAVARDETGGHAVHALEINLRKGGTTHPYAVLRNHVPGRYDVEAGRWVADADGSARAYRATDNLLNPGWQGVPPAAVLKAVGDRGLHLDPERGTGVVLHMLSCLAVDGRFGLTAIGHDADHAAELFDADPDSGRGQRLTRRGHRARPVLSRLRAPVAAPRAGCGWSPPRARRCR